MAERLKAHAWKVCIRQKRIEGSNPSLSAKFKILTDDDLRVIHETAILAAKAAFLEPSSAPSVVRDRIQALIPARTRFHLSAPVFQYGVAVGGCRFRVLVRSQQIGRAHV